MRTPVAAPGPGQRLRPGQGLGSGATASIDARVPGPLRSQPRGPGGRRAGHRRNLHLRFARHAARDQRLWPDRIRRHAEHHARSGRKHPRLRGGSSPTGATGPRRSSRPCSDIPSANGSTRMATANTTCSRSRPAASPARAPTMPAEFRCTTTIRPSSRAALPRQERPQHPARRGHRDRPCADAAVVGPQELSPAI